MLIIDKLNMIYLGLLAIIDKQLHKTQSEIDSSIALFGVLSLLILIDDFYQFHPSADLISGIYLGLKKKSIGKFYEIISNLICFL